MTDRSGSRESAAFDRRQVVAGGAAGLLALAAGQARAEAVAPTATEVLAYYFPAWHKDPQQSLWHGPGWTEWKLLREAKPRFEGHQQPKVPAWGEFDETDPRWSAKEIALASNNGITGFIFDWYWYGGKPFLNDALEQGFLKATNRQRMKFSLMWANHDWLNVFPATPDTSRPLMARGSVDQREFDRVVNYVVTHYFHQPNYLRVDGGLYFSLYELGTFIKGMGGVAAAKAALDGFRKKVRDAGLGSIHLNAVVWGVQVLPSENKLTDPAAVLRDLGFDSLTTYAWVHNYPVGSRSFPHDSYAEAAKASYAAWDHYAADYGLPYHPNVSMGWDPSPRTTQGVPYRSYVYPWHAVMDGNTPAAYETALWHARDWIRRLPPAQRIVTLNAWNEWTEGSYLLPDKLNGTAYVEAVGRVFGRGRRR